MGRAAKIGPEGSAPLPPRDLKIHFSMLASVVVNASVMKNPRAHPSPPGLFQLLLQTKHLLHSTLGASLAWRLGGPWATLGPPKGHPIPNPIPSRQEGRKLPKNTKRNGNPPLHLSRNEPSKRDCHPERSASLAALSGPIRARFWREWAEQPK